ncbi:MAG: prepilin-type N-terminal cleavage/methylation domain-containing protein [Thermodesulfobacteriota bacterium]|jgi:prepilin-type N-terminal cleavage/methylation domain-containing protein
MIPVHAKKGFTLIEIIMTIIIVGIISIVVGPILLQGFTSFFVSSGLTDMDAQGKLAMERMARDIRMIQSPLSSNITTMTATQFTFVTGVTGSNVTVSYQLSGTQLNRNTPILATNVSALTFTYLQNDRVTLATGAGNIWVVQIQLTLSYSGGGFNESKTFQTSVFPRNAP